MQYPALPQIVGLNIGKLTFAQLLRAQLNSRGVSTKIYTFYHLLSSSWMPSTLNRALENTLLLNIASWNFEQSYYMNQIFDFKCKQICSRCCPSYPKKSFNKTCTKLIRLKSLKYKWKLGTELNFITLIENQEFKLC